MKRFMMICVWLAMEACENSGGHDPSEQANQKEVSLNLKKGDVHHEHQEGVVKLSALAVSRSGIRTALVQTGSLETMLTVPAEVQLNPDRKAHISPLVEGQLISVGVTVGDSVKSGQELARLRSVTLGQARADLSHANTKRKSLLQTLKRQKQLRSEGINSKRDLLEAQLAYDQANAERDAALSQLRVFGVRGGSGPDMSLTSPITGLILERHATRGENVTPNHTLFVVADLSKVWVMGRVYEQQISQVVPNMKVTLSLHAYPGKVWPGLIDYVGASVDGKTRTLEIRVELENKNRLLRPGLFGTLRLISETDADSLVLVPLEAVQSVEKQQGVFVPGDEEGEFRFRVLRLGKEGQGQVEVLHGLTANERIVVEGSFILKSELMRSELDGGHAH